MYQKQNWRDETRTQSIKLGIADAEGYRAVEGVSFTGDGQTGDAVNAGRLNHMENGIYMATAQSILPATISYASGKFAVVAELPDGATRATLLGYTNQPYAQGNTMTVNGIAVTLTDLAGEPLPDNAWGNSSKIVVPVQLMIDLSGGTKRAFFKIGGGTKLLIFTGATPPAVTDGLFAKTTIQPVQTKIVDFARAAGSINTEPASFASYRYDPAGFSVGNMGYVAGGYSGGTWLGIVSSYNPVTNLTSNIVSLSNGTSASAAFTIGNIGYVAGGLAGSTYVNDVQGYNPSTNLVSKVATLPNRVAGAAGFAIGDIGYATGGGVSGSAMVDYIQAFNKQSGITSTIANLPRAVIGAAGFSIGNIGYVACGRFSSSGTDLSRALYSFNQQTGLTSTVTNMPEAADGASGFAIGSIGYVTSNTKLYAYNANTGIVSTVGTLPNEGNKRASFAIGNVGYLAMGVISGIPNGVYNGIISYTPNGDTYPDTTLVITPGNSAYSATIIDTKDVSMRLPFSSAYQYTNGKLSKIPARVANNGVWSAEF